MDLSFLNVIVPMLLRGLRATLEISIAGILIGFMIGSLAGYALQGRNRIAKGIAEIYIWIIRGTPLVVQALYLYFVAPALITALTGNRFTIAYITAGIIVIALNSGAFISEIVKGALEGVAIGQTEAGKSLGLTHKQVLWSIIIPPAFKSMVPALFNQFIISVKDTALLSIISVPEMTRQAQNYVSSSFKTIQGYTVLGLFYLALLSILMIVQKYLERKFNLK